MYQTYRISFNLLVIPFKSLQSQNTDNCFNHSKTYQRSWYLLYDHTTIFWHFWDSYKMRKCKSEHA